MATKKKASNKKLKMAWRPVPSAEEETLKTEIEKAYKRISTQDTFISELQMERNEAKAAYAKLKDAVEIAAKDIYGEGEPIMATPSSNLNAICGLVRRLNKELAAWKDKAQSQSAELFHLRQASKAAGILADDVHALLKVLNAKGGK